MRVPNRVLGGVCCLLILPFLAACHGRPLPLSAQAGSTIAIPLANSRTEGLAFGGDDYTDHQRGRLVYQLDGPGGFELDTRGSTVLYGPPEANIALQGESGIAQFVSLVDIPSNAPLGTHTLYVVRRWIDPATGQVNEEPGPGYEGEITILPPVVDANGEPVTGAPTLFESYVCVFNCVWDDVTPQVANVVPRPTVQVDFDPAPHAIELSVTYPAGVVDVADAFETVTTRLNHRAEVWRLEDGPGVVSVSAVADSAAIPGVSVVFTLDDGSVAVLRPGDVDFSVESAWDAEGTPISVSLSSPTLF